MRYRLCPHRTRGKIQVCSCDDLATQACLMRSVRSYLRELSKLTSAVPQRGGQGSEALLVIYKQHIDMLTRSFKSYEDLRRWVEEQP